MKPIAHFDAKFLAPVHQFAAKVDVRYYLKGIHIKPAALGGVLIIATDGHTLIIARDPSGWCKEPLTVSPDAKLVSASRHKKARRFEVMAEGVGIVHDYPEGSEVCGSNARALGKAPLVDCSKFPDVMRVIPKELPGQSAPTTVNPAYLARFQRCFGAMQGNTKDLDGVTLHMPSDASSSVIVMPCGSIDAVGVVMPMRAEPTIYRTDWMAPVSQKPRVRVRAGESTPLEVAA